LGKSIMSEIGVAELGEILQQDAEWMAQHYDKLLEKYPGQVIAINEGEVVAIGEHEVEAYCALRRKADLVGPLVLTIPHPDELMPFLI
jgi:hypothetical protein